MQEQLQLGHIRPTTRPWNTPIFVIPKKNGKWRLLHDLRKVNEVIKNMGALQPGLPSPSMIPKNWDIIIIDLKDCFFTIPLDPEDAERFAFSVPSVNKAEPMKRYHWTVLPQGMKSSPTMCQIYVAWALQPIRLRWPQLIIYHYMDDILIAGKDMDKETIKRDLISSMEKKGLQIAPEKAQETEPWKYLGWEITKTQINPQNLKIRTEIRTLNDVQKLVGDLNWIRTICGISNEDLAPLIELLRGPGDINAPRQLTMRSREALQAIMRRVTFACR